MLVIERGRKGGDGGAISGRLPQKRMNLSNSDPCGTSATAILNSFTWTGFFKGSGQLYLLLLKLSQTGSHDFSIVEWLSKNHFKKFLLVAICP